LRGIGNLGSTADHSLKDFIGHRHIVAEKH